LKSGGRQRGTLGGEMTSEAYRGTGAHIGILYARVRDAWDIGRIGKNICANV